MLVLTLIIFGTGFTASSLPFLFPDSVVTAPGVYRGLCTNYQVTAEVATKAAVRIEETRQPNNRPNIYKAVVESYGILPAE